MKNIVLSFLFFTFGLSLQAQDAPSLVATTSKSQVVKNGRVRVEFTINRQGGDDFKAPDFENFRVLSGPNSSISQSWINGKSSYKQSYVYLLSPTKFGDLTIGKASINLDGKTLESNTLSIQVVDQKDLPADPNDPNYIAEKSVHLVTTVSNKTPYVGEAIYVEYRMYFSQNVGLRQDMNFSNVPNYDGFWHEEVDIKGYGVKQTTFNGEPYRYVVLRKSVLIPQRSGTLLVDNLGLDISVQIPTDQVDYFGNRLINTVNRSFNSGKKTVKVKALPEAGKPVNFTGAVGDYKLIFKADKTELKSNETVTVDLGVSGSGNLKLFETPDLVAPSELEVYTPERKEKVKTGSKGISGKVYDTYTIVPQRAGNYKLPDVRFSYFDPKAKAYKSLESPEILITVTGGQSITAVTSDKQEVVTSNALQYIATKTTLVEVNPVSFVGSTSFYILLLLPMLAIPTGIIIGKARAARRADVAGNRRRRADRLAKKYLSEAKKHIKNKTLFYEALERALHNYLKAILGVETVDISKENIQNLLADKGVDNAAIQEFIQVFDDCEFARYTPITDLMMSQEFEKAKEAISQIDKQL